MFRFCCEHCLFAELFYEKDLKNPLAAALEYEEILKRESNRIEWRETEIAQFVDWINTKAEHYDVLFRLRPLLRDPDDEFLLELSFTAQADYLVSYNVNDFAGSEGVGVRVITAGVFLSLVSGDRS